MARYKPRIGDRVVISDPLYYGREGTVVKKGWLLWHVRCDTVDALGRPIVRLTPRGMNLKREDLNFV